MKNPQNKKTSSGVSLQVFSLFEAVMAGSLIVPSVLSAGERINGTIDTDGDGDGDPLGNGELFRLVDTVQGGGVNQLYHASDRSFEYWTSGKQIEAWEEFIVDGDEDKYFGAHLTEAVQTGGDFWFGQNFTYGLTQATYQMRESTERLPAGTLISLGLRGSDPFGSGTVTLNNNLIAVDLSGAATPPAGYTGSPGLGFGAMANWFTFTVDSLGSMSEWTLKSGKNKKDKKSSGGDNALFQWVAHFDLPAGTSVGQSTPWDLDDNTPDPYAIDDDIVFAWTVNSKNDKTTPPENRNFVPIPEPSSSVALVLGLAVFFIRRNRSRRL